MKWEKFRSSGNPHKYLFSFQYTLFLYHSFFQKSLPAQARHIFLITSIELIQILYYYYYFFGVHSIQFNSIRDSILSFSFFCLCIVVVDAVHRLFFLCVLCIMWWIFIWKLYFVIVCFGCSSVFVCVFTVVVVVLGVFILYSCWMCQSMIAIHTVHIVLFIRYNFWFFLLNFCSQSHSLLKEAIHKFFCFEIILRNLFVGFIKCFHF